MDKKLGLVVFALALLLVLLSAATFLLIMVQKPDSSVRVACVGDSITAGTEYPVDLWQLLGPNYVVGNFGIGGATVALGTDSSWVNETGFPVSLQFKPDIVVIALGTNDASTERNETSASIIASYVQLISRFQALSSKPQIFLMLPPPVFQNNASLSPALFEQNVIPSIRQVATQTGLPLIDAYSPLLNHPEYFVDGVHPNVEGAHIIADVVYSALNSSKS